MLITELNFTQKQALAKEIRRFVEYDKTKIIKETELRKFFMQKKLKMHGISDVKNVLKSHYAPKTISRILSKIQKSVVLDTCICNLSIEEIEELLSNEDFNFIITTDVFKEIIRLSTSSEDKVANAKTAQDVLNLILKDSESSYCTIIDVPSQEYVDNQLITYCKENDYPLYTCDYRLGLRAKVRNIDTKIFTNFNNSDVQQYVPNPSGKNIILCKDIISGSSLDNILSIATEMGANKFILTDELVESLEIMKASISYDNMAIFNSWIHFFVADESDNYLFFSEYDSNNSLKDYVEKNNAIIFSKDLKTCMDYKMNYIPYKFINFAVQKVSINSLSEIAKVKTNNVSQNCDSEELKNLVTDINNNSAIIPYYKPKGHVLSLANIRKDEEVFVIDQFGEEVKPNFKKEIILYPKYRVLHFRKAAKKTLKPYKITVFSVLNLQTSKYSSAIYSAYFAKNELNFDGLPQEYLRYARKLLL